MEQDVSDFLSNAIELEIEAYRNGSPQIAVSVMAGNVLPSLENEIASLSRQGLVVVSQIEVDTCEVWTNDSYSKSTGDVVSSKGPDLILQTITIQQLDSNWYITDVQFYDAPAFCQYQ